MLTVVVWILDVFDKSRGSHWFLRYWSVRAEGLCRNDASKSADFFVVINFVVFDPNGKMSADWNTRTGKDAIHTLGRIIDVLWPGGYCKTSAICTDFGRTTTNFNKPSHRTLKFVRKGVDADGFYTFLLVRDDGGDQNVRALCEPNHVTKNGFVFGMQ